MLIKKILFPIDLSSACSAMAPYVKRAADLFECQVALVHVCDLESHNGFELYLRPPQEIADEHWKLAKRKSDSYLAPEFPPLSIPRIVMSGDPAGQIADLAHKEKFDLIIMPTHAGRFRQMLLGSTVAKILNDVDCPVLTTEHAETIIPRPLDHRLWICGISLSNDSERVLRLASQAAAEVGAKLLIVHVLQHAADEKRAGIRLEALQKTVGCQVPVRFATGAVKEALIDEAQRLASDVLIIGRKPRQGALGRMRDLVYGLVRDSTTPVLSV